MKANFRKPKYIASFFLFILAIVWIGICVVLIFKHELVFPNYMLLFIAEIPICAFAILSFLFNNKAYLEIDGEKIKGRFGLFGRLECNISDIIFVKAEAETLRIVKNKRKYYIKGMMNAYEVSAFIKHRLPFSPISVTESLVADLNKRKEYQKRNIILTVVSIIASFVWVILTVFLTEGKDIPEFGNRDWIIFSIMWVLEIPTVVAIYIFAIKSGKGNIKFEKQLYEARRSVIETTPLVSGIGNIKAVLTNTECTYRITVYSYVENGNTSGYFVVEVLNENYELIFSSGSDVFSEEELTERLETWRGLFDITERVPK